MADKEGEAPVSKKSGASNIVTGPGKACVGGRSSRSFNGRIIPSQDVSNEFVEMILAVLRSRTGGFGEEGLRVSLIPLAIADVDQSLNLLPSKMAF